MSQGSHATDPLARLRRPGVLGSYRGAADDPPPREGGWIASVAVLLRTKPEIHAVPELLFIERATLSSDPWSGHIALPGGRMEEDDGSLLDTAIRETVEETGIALDRVGTPLGRLDLVIPESVRLPTLSVLPFVFEVLPDTAVTGSSPEVADSFWVPLDHFSDPTARTIHRLPVPGAVLSFPGFSVGQRVVWGLTHRILGDLLARSGVATGSGAVLRRDQEPAEPQSDANRSD